MLSTNVYRANNLKPPAFLLRSAHRLILHSFLFGPFRLRLCHCVCLSLSLSLSFCLSLCFSIPACCLCPGSEGAADVLMLIMPSVIAALICQINVSLAQPLYLAPLSAALLPAVSNLPQPSLPRPLGGWFILPACLPRSISLSLSLSVGGWFCLYVVRLSFGVVPFPPSCQSSGLFH